jgi:hypothetical protein
MKYVYCIIGLILIFAIVGMYFGVIQGVIAYFKRDRLESGDIQMVFLAQSGGFRFDELNGVFKDEIRVKVISSYDTGKWYEYLHYTRNIASCTNVDYPVNGKLLVNGIAHYWVGNIDDSFSKEFFNDIQTAAKVSDIRQFRLKYYK